MKSETSCRKSRHCLPPLQVLSQPEPSFKRFDGSKIVHDDPIRNPKLMQLVYGVTLSLPMHRTVSEHTCGSILDRRVYAHKPAGEQTCLPIFCFSRSAAARHRRSCSRVQGARRRAQLLGGSAGHRSAEVARVRAAARQTAGSLHLLCPSHLT